MTEALRIADQLKRAFQGEAWHGPALAEILTGVTSAAAARPPVQDAHSIWQIVLHIAQWESIVRRRIAGELVTEMPAEEDWPPVPDTSEPAWRKALGKLERGNQELRESIAGLADQRLAEKVLGQPYSFYGMLHGVVQHDLYHAGQITLLKKAR